MKKIFSILIALALVLAFSLATAVPVGAQSTWYVNPSGTDDGSHGGSSGTGAFKTLQYAINDARVLSGDTIEVAVGTYNVDAESWQAWGTCIHINKDNLHIKGAGSGSTVLDAQHTYSVLNAPGPTQLHCTVVWVQAQTCTIEGLTVKSGDYGIRANWNGASTSLTLIDVVVDDNYGNGIVFENDITTATFNNVVAQSSGDRGIYFTSNADATTVTLTNTSCNSNGHAGFGCQGSIANLSITGGTFNNNTGGLFHDAYGSTQGPYYGFGIELWNCVGSITGVTASNNGFSGPDAVPGPPFRAEGGAGIGVWDGSKLANNIVITGSSLLNNRNGLWIQDPDSAYNWNWCNWFGTVAVHLSNIVGNTEFGVCNCLVVCPSPPTVDASCNWWGAADGPGHQGPGSGDDVSLSVSFTNWLAEAYAPQKSVCGAYFTPNQGSIEQLATAPTPPNPPVTLPYGMFSFEVCCFTGPVTLTIKLPGPLPEGSVWWKYQNGSWFSLPIGSNDGDDTITLTLTDNGQGDEDPTSGLIKDDGGPGPGGPVGWETHPVNKVRVLLPWVALFAAIIAGAILLVLRRRRAHS